VTELVYTTVDKAPWGEGPWLAEPDKVQWTDEATGLVCLAKRNPRMGMWCGYVGVAEGHRFYGVRYDAVDVDVHGGLTYADFCEEDTPEESSICHAPAPGEPDRLWWLGFDCGHYFDLMPGTVAALRADASAVVEDLMDLGSTYRTLDFVRDECRSLAAQLAAAP
jgi:hypothetical protein